MKLILFVLSFLLLFSCQKEEKKMVPQEGLSTTTPHEDFSDLKEKDESCDDENEKEKLEKALEAKKAVKLQGGDTGCETPTH